MGDEIKPLERRRLGGSDLEVTAIGLGVWAWGARQIWGYGKAYGREELDQVWELALERGLNFIDTASIYGLGESERIVGDLLRRTEQEMVIATKYFPLHLLSGSIRRAAIKSLARLGLKEVDLYQVHWPNPIMSLRSTMREMEGLVREGKVRHIGVSNFNVKQLEAARSYLSREDVVSNQIHYNLIRRKPERDGMVAYAKKEGVTIIAYSPIAQGILTGKYNPGKRPGGMRRFQGRFTRGSLRKASTFLKILDRVARSNDCTMGQTSLAWLLKDPNVVVIPGAKNPRQVRENMGTNECRLTQLDIETLEQAYASQLPTW
jgi:aryl-alcohol dehydrogenase-like predicted oxidoreductase